MQPTPKKLGKIKEWNPSTFLVSFKLETDVSILEKKAKDSMVKYGVDAVVANELKSRRTHVTVYHAKNDRVEKIQLLDPDYDDMISEYIVDHLLEAMNVERYVTEEPESKDEKGDAQEGPKKKRERGGRRERERKERIARKEKERTDRQQDEEEEDDEEDYRRKDIPKGYDRSLELFVSNIVPVKDKMTYAREEDPELHDLFSAYGEVVKMKFIRSTFGLATIKAYVEYDNEKSAKTAV